MNSETNIQELDLTEAEGALAAAVLEIVRHVDATEHSSRELPGRFALFSTQQLLRTRPKLAAFIPEETRTQATGDAYHLTSIELGTHKAHIGDELLECSWPDDLVGGLVHGTIHGTSERLPQHNQETPVFIVVGALLGGETFCAVKPSSTEPFRVGRALVPELVHALCASLGLDTR